VITSKQTGSTWLSLVIYMDRVRRQRYGPMMRCRSMQVYRAMLVLSVVAALLALPKMASSQSLPILGASSAPVAGAASVRANLAYEPPTEKTKFGNYGFDAFGPYPIVGSAVAAGIDQISNSPPEWRQGASGYGKRFGSDYGIVAAGTTARYGLAEAFKVDTLYYRCECSGFLPRLRHALVSSVTARRGIDGHAVFSVPAIVAPYAGTATAVYGWYPSRFGVKDAFRMGNYSLLAYAGENIGLEFFYSGPHSLLSRMHLSHSSAAGNSGPSQ